MTGRHQKWQRVEFMVQRVRKGLPWNFGQEIREFLEISVLKTWWLLSTWEGPRGSRHRDLKDVLGFMGWKPKLFDIIIYGDFRTDH